MTIGLIPGFAEEKTLVSGTPTATVGSISTSKEGSGFLCVIRPYSPSVTAVTDNYSNTYAYLGSLVIGGTTVYVYFCTAGVGGPGHKPLVTQTTGDLATISFSEVPGGLLASILDGAMTTSLDASSPFDSQITTTNPNDLIIGIVASNASSGSVTYTPGAGFALAAGSTWASAANAISLGVMSRRVTATGTYGPNATTSSGTSAAVLTIALKERTQNYNFSALATSGNWTDSNFTQDTVNWTQLILRAQTLNGVLSAVAAPTAGTAQGRAFLNGRTWGTTFSGKITLFGVNSFAVTDDGVHLNIFVQSGGNQWKGYWWQIQNGFQRLFRQDNAVTYGGSTALAAATSDSIAEGDTFELSFNTSTGVLIGKHNGTQITTATDSTYVTNVAPGFAASDGNHGGTGISQFDSSGEVVLVPVAPSYALGSMNYF